MPDDVPAPRHQRDGTLSEGAIASSQTHADRPAQQLLHVNSQTLRCDAAGLLIGLAIAIMVIGCVCGRYRRQHRGKLSPASLPGDTPFAHESLQPH